MNRTGISPVTTRTVVWSPAIALACKACHVTSAVFACGVHPPATGSLTPGYVLCCAVRKLSSGGSPQGQPTERQMAGHSTRPEPAGRISRRHETRKAT